MERQSFMFLTFNDNHTKAVLLQYLSIFLCVIFLCSSKTYGQITSKGKGNIYLTSSMLTALDGAEKSGSKEVAKVFSSPEFKTIYTHLYEDYKTKIISGRYYIRKNFESKHVVNYIFGAATPLTFQNMEFVLQFNKAE